MTVLVFRYLDEMVATSNWTVRKGFSDNIIVVFTSIFDNPIKNREFKISFEDFYKELKTGSPVIEMIGHPYE